MGIDNENITVEHRVDVQPPSADAGIPRRWIIIGVVALIVVFAIIAILVYLLLLPTTDTARIRDLFIIFMALESLVLGLVLILLVVQIARLTNLLQNEIKPILESMNETVNTLRGTTAFLSDNLVEPVMKFGEYGAALQQMVALFGFGRRRTRSK